LTLGAGIFLSAIFLGCVFLYIKSDNKPRWRKIVLWSSIISISSIAIFFTYLIYKDEVKESKQNNNENAVYTEIKNIKLGEQLSDLQFRHGKFVKVTDKVTGYLIYKSENGVLVWERNGKAERLTYNCREYADQIRDFTRLGTIACYTSGESVLRIFGKNNVEIKCFEKDVEERYYEVSKHNIGFILKKNQVVTLMADLKEIRRPYELKDCV